MPCLEKGLKETMIYYSVEVFLQAKWPTPAELACFNGCHKAPWGIDTSTGWEVNSAAFCRLSQTVNSYHEVSDL